MSRFFESIKLSDDQFFRIPNHQKRVNRTFAIHFPDKKTFSIEEILKNSDFPATGTYKIRISYDENDISSEIQSYTVRKINSLKLVNINTLPSFFKAEMRDIIHEAANQKGDCDDIIMVNNGLLTDTSYANIALFDGKTWFTPRKPYLYGSHRDFLLDNGLMVEKDIPVTEVYNYRKIRIFNAMIEFGDAELDINPETIR